MRNYQTTSLLLAAFAFLFGPQLFAQDSLFYTNGNVIIGQVEEVGLDQVRYRTSSGNSIVLIVVAKTDLLRIKLQGGQEFVYSTLSKGSAATPDFLARKRAITIDLIAPALNHAVVGYEQVVFRNVDLVVKVGYIGLGIGEPRDTRSIDRRSQGLLIKAGVKFLLPVSRRRLPNPRDEHPLNGWYLCPELIFSGWTLEETNDYFAPYQDQPTHTDYTSVALNFAVGRQVVIGDRYIFDIHGGLGYGAQWQDGVNFNDVNNYYYNYRTYMYSHTFLSRHSPLIMSGGILFGYLF